MRLNQPNRCPNPGLIPGRQGMTVAGLSLMYGFLTGKPCTRTDEPATANTVSKSRAQLSQFSVKPESDK